jgi:hypothetical protein
LPFEIVAIGPFPISEIQLRGQSAAPRNAGQRISQRECDGQPSSAYELKKGTARP